MLSVYSLPGVFFVLGDFFASLKKEERKGMDRGWVQSPFPALVFFFFFTLTLSFFFVFVFVFVFVFAFAFSFSLAFFGFKKTHSLFSVSEKTICFFFASKKFCRKNPTEGLFRDTMWTEKAPA